MQGIVGIVSDLHLKIVVIPPFIVEFSETPVVFDLKRRLSMFIIKDVSDFT